MRSYDPQIGRFLQSDPYDQFASGYVGMGNDPVNTIDPSGGWGGEVAGSFSRAGEVQELGDVVVTGSKALVGAKAAKSGFSLANSGLSLVSTATRAVADATNLVKTPANVTPGGSGKCQNCSANDDIAGTSRALYNEVLTPAADWINHNVNIVYLLFNGVNSQFTGEDFLSGDPMSHGEGATDVAIVLVGGTLEKAAVSSLEKVLFKGGRTALSNVEKSLLRDEAREIWFKKTGKKASWSKMEVHHRIPLEWSHLFDADPNRISNLIAIDENVHRKLITPMWNSWKRALGREPTAAEVMKEALLIDQLFGSSMKFIK